MKGEGRYRIHEEEFEELRAGTVVSNPSFHTGMAHGQCRLREESNVDQQERNSGPARNRRPLPAGDHSHRRPGSVAASRGKADKPVDDYALASGGESSAGRRPRIPRRSKPTGGSEN